jgi:hypothetical protein
LLEARPRLEHVTQDHVAIGPVLPQHSDGLSQLPGVLVNVGE